MINILDRYEQISFDYSDDNYNYIGTSNIKQKELTSIDITIKDKNDHILGTMNSQNGNGGVSVNLINSTDLDNLFIFAQVLRDAKIELEKLV